MFDIGWSEILVIAVVAIVVVGPKELPRMLRTFGKTMGTVRRTANDFKRQFDEALREAERDAGLEETRKSLQSIGNPLADLRKDLQGPAVARPAAVAAATPALPQVHEAPPLKTGAAEPERGSDAA
jgi:sec-independent protein translocase protein TatB